MSIQIRKEQERTITRDKDGIPTAKTVQYLIHGAASEEEAFALLQSTTPGYLDNLKINEYETNEVKGSGAFTYDVNYTKMSDAEYGDLTGTGTSEKYSFDTSGGTATMKQALDVSEKHSSLATTPDMEKGINWDGEQFNGVDIVVSNIVEGRSHTVRKNRFTTDYKRKLAELTGTVNNASFKGWNAGEVLFLGASASDTDDDYVEINFKFAISPNETNLSYADFTINNKKGWEYVWAYYDQKNEENKPVLPKAIAVYVCKTYKEEDFSQLGIGV
jgi:hypothetical protein